MDWDEKKYEMQEEAKKAASHDCQNHRDECDMVHPSIAKNVLAQMSQGRRRPQPHPKKWRNWLLTPKVCIWYMNQHTMQMQAFNMTEAFAQMSGSAKLNVFNHMFENLLDENEKSLFLSDVMGEISEDENR